jgi:hypothetical protein
MFASSCDSTESVRDRVHFCRKGVVSRRPPFAAVSVLTTAVAFASLATNGASEIFQGRRSGLMASGL